MCNAIRLFVLSALIGLPIAAWSGPVDINTADAKTLAAELRGIGETTAAAIVAYRTANGPFKTVDDLVKVRGIGNKILEQNRTNLRVGAEKPAAEK
jgi:competence protein ComEA